MSRAEHEVRGRLAEVVGRVARRRVILVQPTQHRGADVEERHDGRCEANRCKFSHGYINLTLAVSSKRSGYRNSRFGRNARMR